MVELLENLLSSQLGVRASNVGVIAPYRKQVLQLRRLLRARRLGTIRVGSVDGTSNPADPHA